ncbi:MAG: CGNR zinc finger domain-containing protein [Jatrophihabitans sp.]
MTNFRSGYGATWLDLLATVRNRYKPQSMTDYLADPAALRAWLTEHDLQPTGAVTDSDLSRTRELREALHRTVLAVLASTGPAASDLRLMDAALAADRPLRVRRTADTLRVARPVSVDEALARLTRQAVTDLADPQRTSLRSCGDDVCSGVFLDPTGRRRWCSDELCGVRHRVREHRARARAAR